MSQTLSNLLTVTSGLFLVTGGPALAQPSAPPPAECCQHKDLAAQYGIIWTGLDPVMVERLIAYAAPVLWFSPDEPLLKEGPRRLKGKVIAIPTSFPFEDASEQPVVYYRVKRILQRLDEPGEGAYVADAEARGQSRVSRTPLRFFRKLGTTFWGFRAGIQVRGVWSFDHLGFVFEFGAGSW